MRYDQSVRALKDILQRGWLGEPVLGTIEMRAIPHWMPWSEKLHSLSTFVMSIHHLDTFRYWFGTPDRVLASTRPDPRTRFPHSDGINLYILEYDNGCRASAWDDVWTGPAREGSESDIYIRWRVEGTEGLARGTIGWPSYPAPTPSTLDFTSKRQPGYWLQPRWREVWFPDAFVGTMAQLLCALEDNGAGDQRVGQPGNGGAVRGGLRSGEGAPGNDGERIPRLAAPLRVAAKRLTFSLRCTLTPRSAGLSATAMPAACRAAIFSFAVPLPPLMMAPAWPMRLPGGAVWPAMNAATGFLTYFLTNSAAFSSAVPPISPIIRIASVCGSSWNSRKHVDERGADDRVAADADAGGLAQAEVGQLPDGLVGQGAAAADDADRAGLVDVAGHDADLALAGRDDAGAVGADQPAGPILEELHRPRHVEHRNALGDGDDDGDAGVGRFHDGVGGGRRRHEDHGGVGTGLARPPRPRC